MALKAKSATDRRGAAEPDRAVLSYALMPPALVSLMKGVVGILPARRRAGEFLAPVRGKPFPQPFFLGYRESAGTVIAQIAYKHVARLAESFLKEGDCGVFNEDAMQYSQLQNLFEGRE